MYVNMCVIVCIWFWNYPCRILLVPSLTSACLPDLYLKKGSDYGIGRLGYIQTGQDSFLKGLETKLRGKKGQKITWERLTKMLDIIHIHFVILHSHSLLSHISVLPLMVQVLVLISPSAPKGREKRGLERGHVCAWRGGEPEASPHQRDSLCTVLSRVLLACSWRQGQCFIPLCNPMVPPEMNHYLLKQRSN